MDKTLGMLGLAQKAGRVQIGEEPVGTAAAAGKARLILLASDAASNSRNRAAKFAALHGTPLLDLPYDIQSLGGIFGRASCACGHHGFSDGAEPGAGAGFGGGRPHCGRTERQEQPRWCEKARSPTAWGGADMSARALRAGDRRSEYQEA